MRVSFIASTWAHKLCLKILSEDPPRQQPKFWFLNKPSFGSRLMTPWGSANRGELSLLVPFAQGWEAVESLGQWDVSPGLCPVEAADPFHASFILPSCWETRGFVSESRWLLLDMWGPRGF